MLLFLDFISHQQYGKDFFDLYQNPLNAGFFIKKYPEGNLSTLFYWRVIYKIFLKPCIVFNCNYYSTMQLYCWNN